MPGWFLRQRSGLDAMQLCEILVEHHLAKPLDTIARAAC
jgi:hypothetical protein